jgi:hypothetical protein
LDTSTAWNLRAGPQLQWLGITSRYFVFNDGLCSGQRLELPGIGTSTSSDSASVLGGSIGNETSAGDRVALGLAFDEAAGAAAAAGGWCAVVYDVQQLTRTRVMRMPVHTVSPDGTKATSINFQRLDAASPGAAALLLPMTKIT